MTSLRRCAVCVDALSAPSDSTNIAVASFQAAAVRRTVTDCGTLPPVHMGKRPRRL